MMLAMSMTGDTDLMDLEFGATDNVFMFIRGCDNFAHKEKKQKGW